MKEFFLIANPVSNFGRVKKDWNKISNLLLKHNLECEVVFAAHPRHEKELVIEAIQKGYRKFIALGGDGTLNEMINGIFSGQPVPADQISIGVIPGGMGNDWCRTFNIPDNYEKAIEIIKAGKTFLHDVGITEYIQNDKLQKHFFINMAGLGYDAFVVKKMNEEKKKGLGGKLSYYAGILKYLFKYESVDIKFTLDGISTTVYTMSATVGICKYNGGGMMQSPYAMPDDGILNLTIIKHISTAQIIADVLLLKNGSFINKPYVQTFSAQKIEVTSSPVSYVEADGETVGQTPAAFSILPKAVKMIVA